MKIKTIILAITLVLGLSPLARAQMVVSTPFDYTGVTAMGGDALWVPGNGNSYIATGVFDEYANSQQFTISTPTDISSLNITTSMFAGSIQPAVNATLTWSINSNSISSVYDSPVPNTNSFIQQSAPITFTLTPEEVAEYSELNPYIVTEQIPFNIDLQPGTYWITEQASQSSEGFILPTQTYNDTVVAPVPEPPTIGLFLVAAVGFVFLKRKNLGFGRLA